VKSCTKVILSHIKENVLYSMGIDGSIYHWKSNTEPSVILS